MYNVGKESNRVSRLLPKITVVQYQMLTSKRGIKQIMTEIVV